MKYLLYLAYRSIFNRRLTSALTILSIALSVGLLLAVEKTRVGARDAFTNTISQTDLIVGAKGGTLQLLLYSVFRLGSATDNVGYETYQHFARHPAVEWTIPYSLGDSHRGFRVVGTNEDFYKHYRFQRDREIRFAKGEAAKKLFDVVLGADVARELGYQMEQKIVLAHGITDVAIVKHDDMPFTIVGVLEKTGTPIDRSIYITLEGMEAIHIDWADGAPPQAGKETDPQSLRKDAIKIGQITAFLLRSKNRIDTLHLQREINDYTAEPLMAIIPGVALSELWQTVSYAETALQIVAIMVVFVGLLGMIITLYNSLNERRREMAILRAVGAGPGRILSLLIFESWLLTLCGCIGGVALVQGAMIALGPWIESEFGLTMNVGGLSSLDFIYLGMILLVGFLMGLLPGIRAYRNTLVDGLTIRI